MILADMILFQVILKRIVIVTQNIQNSNLLVHKASNGALSNEKRFV